MTQISLNRTQLSRCQNTALKRENLTKKKHSLGWVLIATVHSGEWNDMNLYDGIVDLFQGFCSLRNFLEEIFRSVQNIAGTNKGQK